MATTLTTPQAIGQPFATSGDKATLPETTAAAGVASLNKGIPAECSLPLDGGGSAVRRTDINALGYLATSFQYFMQNGGVMSYNADVSSSIGGYPTGARLWASLNGNTVIVRSTADNNTTNPISGSAPNQTIATNWVMDVPDKAYVDLYAMKYSGATVFYGIASVTWKDLDLSATIGTNRALVFLQIEPNGDTSAISVRMKGDPKTFPSQVGGMRAADCNASTEAAQFMIVTDASGVIEWQAGQARETVVKLICYQILK